MVFSLQGNYIWLLRISAANPDDLTLVLISVSHIDRLTPTKIRPADEVIILTNGSTKTRVSLSTLRTALNNTLPYFVLYLPPYHQTSFLYPRSTGIELFVNLTTFQGFCRVTDTFPPCIFPLHEFIKSRLQKFVLLDLET